MLRALLAGVALFLGTATTRPQAPVAFSMVLESTPTGWAAQCDSGCEWQRLAFDCGQSCDAMVDANGLHTIMSANREPAAFRFRVVRTAKGVRAIALAGTTWQTLTWNCHRDPCRARVDPFGVSRIDLRR